MARIGRTFGLLACLAGAVDLEPARDALRRHEYERAVNLLGIGPQFARGDHVHEVEVGAEVDRGVSGAVVRE